MTVSIDIVVADARRRWWFRQRPFATRRETQPWVLVLGDGRATRTPVRLARAARARWRLATGAPAGTVVVLTPDVAPGSRVRAAPAR